MDILDNGNTFSMAIAIKCSNLCLLDGATRLDPVCVMYQKHNHANETRWNEVGRTERLSNTKDPTWANEMQIEYNFGEIHDLKFEVYHFDAINNSDWGLIGDSTLQNLQLLKNCSPSCQECIGRCQVSLCELIASRGGKYSANLNIPGMSEDWAKALGFSTMPKIFITANEKKITKEIVTFEIQAENLDKKDFLGKSDPYLSIFSHTGTGEWNLVYKSEVIEQDLNPTWNPFTLDVSTLCKGDYNKDIKFQVDDWDSIGSHDYIGSCIITLHQLMNNNENKLTFKLTNTEKRRHNKESGSLIVNRCDVEVSPTFIEHLQMGTKINLWMAFDFTDTNGDPAEKQSLHYLNPNAMENHYTFTTKSIAEGAGAYGTSKNIFALGFGARVPPTGALSHNFPLNVSAGGDSFCLGFDGILEAYQQTLQTVTFSDPCNLAPIINHAAKHVQTFMIDCTQYFVLIILTHGGVNDLEATKAAIVAASDWPLSVIIVGICDGDFSALEEFKAEVGPLNVNGKVASRVNCHFVELPKIMPSDALSNHSTSSKNNWQKFLAIDILTHVPGQLLTWMIKNGKIIRSL